jgi:flagellar motor switch protein FliM
MDSPEKISGTVSIAEKLKEIAKLSIDKLPVLNSIFERMGNRCVEDFHEFAPPAFTAFINQIVTGDSWDLLESLADSVAVIFYCREWDARIVIGLERRFVFAIMEAMFGGEGTEAPFEASRPFTPTEARIGRVVCEFAAKALEWAFSSVCEITLEAERLETALEFTTLGHSSMMMIHAQILFQVLNQGGIMFVLMPQSSMTPIRQKLERERKPIASSHDTRWTSALNTQISHAGLTVNAVLDGKEMELRELLRLQPGKVIELAGTEHSVILECEGDRLFRGHLGQTKGFFTFTIEEAINDESGETESLSR